MPAAVDSIATRQLAEVFFRTSTPLAIAASVSSPVRLVDGHHAVNLLASSNSPFTIFVEEACFETGPFIRSATYGSVVVAGVQQVCRQHLPCGPYIRTTLMNAGGGQTFLSYCVEGLPQP
jgi:hypothetical protein